MTGLFITLAMIVIAVFVAALAVPIFCLIYLVVTWQLTDILIKLDEAQLPQSSDVTYR